MGQHEGQESTPMKRKNDNPNYNIFFHIIVTFESSAGLLLMHVADLPPS